MKVVQFSNYINHHQIPLANAFNSISGVEYIFVATTPFNAKRAAMGYTDENSKYEFVLKAYECAGKERQAHSLAKEADIVIVGSAPDVYMSERLDLGKVTFHTSERYFKKGLNIKTFPQYFASAMKHIRPYENKPLYYLCSSAYTAKDVNTFTKFFGRCYKWAYFTEVWEYAEQDLIQNRVHNEIPIILWAGRFVDWKHPDVAIRIADKLRKQGFNFRMEIIGGGDMESHLKSDVQKYHLEESVFFLDYLPPAMVRKHMEKADVFLFTSDFNEGWGAVLNEAMSSGCAVISSHAPGAAPYLVQDGENGFLYQNGNENHLFQKAKQLLSDTKMRQSLGLNAYKSLRNIWNANVAADRLIVLNDALTIKESSLLFPDGPCSPAPILENGWYCEK